MNFPRNRHSSKFPAGQTVKTPASLHFWLLKPPQAKYTVILYRPPTYSHVPTGPSKAILESPINLECKKLELNAHGEHATPHREAPVEPTNALK